MMLITFEVASPPACALQSVGVVAEVAMDLTMAKTFAQVNARFATSGNFQLTKIEKVYAQVNARIVLSGMANLRIISTNLRAAKTQV